MLTRIPRRDGFGVPKLTPTLAKSRSSAFSPADQPKNILQVGLQTTSKRRGFRSRGADRFAAQSGALHRPGPYDPWTVQEIPVNSGSTDALSVPLPNAMLYAGNYRWHPRYDMVTIQPAATRTRPSLGESTTGCGKLPTLARSLGRDDGRHGSFREVTPKPPRALPNLLFSWPGRFLAVPNTSTG